MTPDLLRELNADLDAHTPVCVATHLQTGAQRRILPAADDPLAEAVATALRTDQPQRVEDADGTWFVRPYNPPLRLLIVGAVHIAQPLVRIAEEAGYAVTVCDPRTQWAAPERFPGVELSTEWPDELMEESFHPDVRTAIVSLTHDAKIDDPALSEALKSPAFYIGALGSTRTHAKRRQRLLKHEHVTEELFDRIAGPIGLNIGARTPAEIAIAIVAQMTLALRGAK